MYLHLENSRKRKRGERVFDFHTFGDPGCPADYDGAFRDNIRNFLEKCAERESYDVEGMPLWSVVLQEDSHAALIPVFIVEESVHEDMLCPHCDHCRCVGWSHHLVSKRRYHFIIPGSEKVAGNRKFGGFSGLMSFGSGKVCASCHDPVPPDRQKCSTCGEEGVQASVLDMQSHLLHGMLHSNGFGHLLCINGRENGSLYASGREIMDLWDRICAMLRARKVSVEDVATKRSMELRLLHCVAYGESWFGRWGYKFGHGSFGVTQQMYAKAIQAIRGMPLSVMTQHFRGVDDDVAEIVARYHSISGRVLQTVGELLRCMMELKARLPPQRAPPTTRSPTETHPREHHNEEHNNNNNNNNNCKLVAPGCQSPIPTDMPCRWSAKRLELATQVIVEALKKCEKKWVPRQDVRDAARVYIGDTGLLDFVLKSLGNRVVGGHMVRRAVNPVSKVLEYSLEDAAKFASVVGSAAKKAEPRPPARGPMGREQVLRDIAYLYKHALERYKPARKARAIPTAARIILDAKRFVKDHGGETTRKGAANSEWGMDEDQMLRVMCAVALGDEVAGSSPPDLLVLPPHATVGDLKREAQRALRETYCIMREVRVDSIRGLEGGDEDLLFGAIESGSCVLVEGSGIDMATDLRYQGGTDNWTVDCPCGATDDDGERMIACDMCQVWQHTRCGGISDADAIPHLFLCSRCGLALFQAML